MSFGASPSDIIIVVTSCRELYRKCRSAGGEYDEISREVRGLHTVLKHLKSEVEDQDSPLNRDRDIWGRQLAPIIGDSNFTLKQLDGLLMKYGGSSEGNGSGNGSDRGSWDKTRFGSNEMDQLGGIRVKLISHKTSLIQFLDTIPLYEDGKMAKDLDVQGEQLDIILDKVDHIAAKMSQKAGTFMTSYDDDDDMEVWKQFRRKLILEGFSIDVLEQHKYVLRAYIQQMEQDGLLAKEPPTPQMPSPVSPHTERWIDSTHSESSHGQPPSFDSINIGSDDNGAKEMIQREDNTKFPTSMKLERPKPEPRLDPYIEGQPERYSTPIRRQLSPPLTPKMSTTDFTERKRQKDRSGSAPASDTSSIHRTKSPSNSSIIQTSDLLLLPFPAIPRLIPSSSPSSYHSHLDEETQSVALRPKPSSDQGSLPRASGVRFDLPDRQSSPKISTPLTGTSPRSDSAMSKTRLAPDSYGNEIPPDAKWTKVKRSLISPEVLNQDGRRFEARPEFVAVLGILTKEEIQDYASRSHILREERWRRHHEASITSEQRSRRERTTKTRRRNSSASESPSYSSDGTSDSDSDSNDDRRRAKGRDQRGSDRKRYNRENRREDRGEGGNREERSKRRERTERKERDREPSYTFSTTTTPYPPSNPQTQPQPQPFSTSPQSASNNTPRPWNIPGAQLPQGYPPPPLSPQQGYPQQVPYPTQNQQYYPGPPYPQQYPAPPHQYLSPQPYTPHANSNSPRHSPSSPTYFPSSSSPSNKPHSPDYNPHHRHRHRHHSHHSRDRDRDRDIDSHDKFRDGRGGVSGKAPTTGSRWRDHLTAAGLGGAAVGLLNVLSEAADGF